MFRSRRRVRFLERRLAFVTRLLIDAWQEVAWLRASRAELIRELFERE